MTSAAIAAPVGGTTRGVLIAAWAGVFHVVLATIASALLTGEAAQPSWTDPSETIVDFYRTSSFDGVFVTGVLMVGVAFVVFLVFAAKVAELVGGADGGSRWVGWLIFGAVAMETAFGIFGYLASFMAPVFRASHGGMADVGYLVLHDLRFSFYWLDLLAMPVWMIPLGVAIIRTRYFPAWLGWAFSANAVLLFVALYLPVTAWNVGSGLPLLWVLVMAVIMIRDPERFAASPLAADDLSKIASVPE